MTSDILQDKQTRLLYAGLPNAIAANTLLSLILVATQHAAVAQNRLFIWVALIGMIVLARTALAVAWHRSGQHAPEYEPAWLRRFRITTIATGLIWGSGVLFLFPAGDIPHQVFLAFVMAGLSAGAVTSLSIDRVSSLGFLVPMLLPLSLRLTLEEGEIPLAMGIMVALYLFFVVSNSAHARSSLLENIQLHIAADLREQALRRSEELFKSTFMHSKVGMNIISPDYKYLKVNRAFCEMTGYSEAELLANDFKIVTHPDDIEPNLALSRKLLANEIDSYNMEMRYFHRDGRMLYVDLTVSAVHDDQGKVQLIIAIVQDITPRKRAENSLKILNEGLEHKVDQKIAELREKDHLLIDQARLASMGEMINNIAHQWRQPLSIIGLTFQNIALDFQDGVLDRHSMQEYLDNAMRVVNKMSTTIDDFRNFFRPNRDKIAFSLHDAIAQAVALIEISLKHHNIALHMSEEAYATVQGYPNEFSQVLLNLLSNAKDALLERHIQSAAIDVHIRCERGFAIVTVRDNGGGIPDEIIAKIFDPYFTTKASGTGIGLYMSKMIMENMGGTIAARNTGGGAEFVLSLPLSNPPHGSQT